ncbi:hypothetical protein GCM10020369_58260 [Cryptosporangium minutisporangium]|uniref:Uncharacterized protein n=1 Tax=Cryptosporangium minutisporangium TaxID=113569 RepID=A0ABP6T645_9ACTN
MGPAGGHGARDGEIGVADLVAQRGTGSGAAAGAAERECPCGFGFATGILGRVDLPTGMLTLVVSAPIEGSRRHGTGSYCGGVGRCARRTRSSAVSRNER